ncbi:hypothetical protein [Burkholderia ubonensis]|uniref:hypothetical protein n=1 Tax=Burkholderia ubonensis TaxID=101571 RepID=UPI0015832B1B
MTSITATGIRAIRIAASGSRRTGTAIDPHPKATGQPRGDHHRIACTAGYDQFHGGLAGPNFGWMSGNSMTGSAAAVPLAGLDFREIQD